MDASSQNKPAAPVSAEFVAPKMQPPQQTTVTEQPIPAETERYHNVAESQPRAQAPRVIPSNTAGVYSIVKPEQTPAAESHAPAQPAAEAVPGEGESN
jgi:hypothetical protein